ncbi:uncharacterized protein [Typha angustifolia]|uniref:uncharacterized protein n=1 Tax=Typha angustifolia TaxID=59011 RepID=UPI003C2D4D50
MGSLAHQVDGNWLTITWHADAEKDIVVKANIASTLRQVWKQRNTMIFSGSRLSPKVIIRKVQAMAKEYAKREKVSKETTTREQAKWEAPDIGWVKLNTDGCYDARNYQGGVGMVLRDEDGKARGQRASADPRDGLPGAHNYPSQ